MVKKIIPSEKPSAYCIMFDAHGKMLLLDRVFEPHGHCLPGGRIENYESPLEALRREIMEETGIITTRKGFRFLRMDKSAHDRDIWIFVYDIPVDPSWIRLSIEHKAFRFANPLNGGCCPELSGKTMSYIRAYQDSSGVMV